jgi:hypothetical protein
VEANQNLALVRALRLCHRDLALLRNQNHVQSLTFRKDALRVFIATTYFTRQLQKPLRIILVLMNLLLGAEFTYFL